MDFSAGVFAEATDFVIRQQAVAVRGENAHHRPRPAQAIENLRDIAVAIFDQLVDRQIPLVRGQGGLGGFDSDFLKNALAKPVEKNRFSGPVSFSNPIQECC
jgi:hypothetical protein